MKVRANETARTAWDKLAIMLTGVLFGCMFTGVMMKPSKPKLKPKLLVRTRSQQLHWSGTNLDVSLALLVSGEG